MKRVDWPLLLVFALGPIQWVTLLDVGLALKPVHLVMFPMAAYGLAQVLSGLRIVDVPKGTIVFWVAFFAYLFSLVVSLLHSLSPAEGFSQIAKMLIYGVMGLGIALYIATRPRETLLRTLCLAPLISAGTFLIVANIVLATRGISMMGLVVRALETGNPAVLQFALFLNLFNTPDQLAIGERAPTSLRHVALAFVWAAGMSAAAVALSWRGARGLMAAVAWTGVVISALVVLLSVSRSLILAIFLAAFVLGLARVLSRKPMSLREFGFVATLTCLAIIGVSLSDNFTNIVGGRFTALENDGRLGNFQTALQAISSAPVLGSGVGAEVAAGARVNRGVVYVQVHNLFLAAWLQGGIFSLVAAIVYLGGLATFATNCLSRVRTDPVIGYMAAVLALPLLRSQISGESGNFTIAEWLCIAIAFGLAVKLQKRATQLAGTEYNRPGSAASPLAQA